MRKFGSPTAVFQSPDSPSSPAPAAGSDTPSVAPASPSPAPESTPSPSGAPPEGAAETSDFEFMFGTEGGDPVDQGLGSSPPVTASPEPKPPQPAPAQPEKPAAKVEEPAKPAPAATPAPTEATSPTTATQPSPTLDPYDPGTLARHLADNEEAVIQQLADSQFKLSDKDVEALESNVTEAIPRLLAKVAVTMQRNFLTQLATVVPRMVHTHGEVTKRHTEAENEFYQRWPDVKKDLHGQTVLQYAAVYRQMHPEATRKEMIEAVGPMVMMAAKVVPSAQVSPSPMTNGAGRPPQPAPFVPAGPSAGGGAVPSTAPELSPIEAMFLGEPQ